MHLIRYIYSVYACWTSVSESEYMNFTSLLFYCKFSTISRGYEYLK